MPIRPARELTRIGQEEFREIDYIVTGLGFQVHRELGPGFIAESIYRDELARQCESRQLSPVTELPLLVTFETFSKSYFLDLVVNTSVLYELKAVEAIHSKHRNQVLNYLMLTGLAHAKIFNMRAASLEYEFVSTSITHADRYAFQLDTEHWQDLDDDSRWLRELVMRLIADWGLFLDVTLFYDAIVHFRGGKDEVIQPIEIRRGGRLIGQQSAHLISPHVAFKVTAMSTDVKHFEDRLRRFLCLTSLRAIQWINFNRRTVRFKTLMDVSGS